MSKVYIYRKKDDTVTIYYSKRIANELNISVFEYNGEIPEGEGVLKTDGKNLYREKIVQDNKFTEKPSVSELEQLRADVDYIAIMTGVEL